MTTLLFTYQTHVHLPDQVFYLQDEEDGFASNSTSIPTYAEYGDML